MALCFVCVCVCVRRPRRRQRPAPNQRIHQRIGTVPATLTRGLASQRCDLVRLMPFPPKPHAHANPNPLAPHHTPPDRVLPAPNLHRASFAFAFVFARAFPVAIACDFPVALPVALPVAFPVAIAASHGPKTPRQARLQDLHALYRDGLVSPFVVSVG